MEKTVSINETPSNYMETVIMVHLIYCEERGNYSPNKVSPIDGVEILVGTRISTGRESLFNFLGQINQSVI